MKTRDLCVHLGYEIKPRGHCERCVKFNIDSFTHTLYEGDQGLLCEFHAMQHFTFHDWEDSSLTPKQLKQLKKLLSKAGTFYHPDNLRLAEVGNEVQEALYLYRENKGCCGFYDKVLTLDGVDFKVGFNYGH